MRRLVAIAALSISALLAGSLYLVIAEDSGSSSFEDEIDSFEDDDVLEALYEECDDGDMEACDDLYYESPVGSDYEHFGSTCGEREDELDGGCS